MHSVIALQRRIGGWYTSSETFHNDTSLMEAPRGGLSRPAVVSQQDHGGGGAVMVRVQSAVAAIQ